MKLSLLGLVLFLPLTVCAAEPAVDSAEGPEPTLYDHYHSLKRLQESLAGRSLEDQAKLQPQIKRAERKACDRLRKEHKDGVSKDEYRRQGGDEFLVFSHQFEQYCESVR